MLIDSLTELLKELRNYSRKLFLCPPQKYVKHNQRFKLLFFKISLHFGTSNRIFAYRKHYLVFSSLEMLITLIQTKVYYTTFLFCLKRNNSLIYKSSSCKEFFSPVCMLLCNMNVFYSL